MMTQNEQNQLQDKERREVMAALLKYSAAVGGASTVVLSASEAVAKSAASGFVKARKEKCNNGWGNGDQCVPGNSWKNQAENKGADPIFNPNPDNTPFKPGKKKKAVKMRKNKKKSR